MKKIIGPIRRASIYGSISYFGLVLINNSNLDLPSLWIAYLPMFIAVYALTQWLDRRFGWLTLQEQFAPNQSPLLGFPLYQTEESLSMKGISICHSPNSKCGNRCKNNSCPCRELSLLPLVLRSLKTTCHGDWFQLSRFGSWWCLNSRNVIKSERCWKVDLDGIAVRAEFFHPFIHERERWWGHAKAWMANEFSYESGFPLDGYWRYWAL